MSLNARPSLQRYGVLLAAFLAAIAAVAVGSFYAFAPHPTGIQREAAGRPVMASQIEFLAQSMGRLADHIAAHPDTLACFQTSNPDICRAQAANLHALSPQATVLFITNGTDGARQLLPGFLPGDTSQLVEQTAHGGAASTSASFSLSISRPVLDSQGNRLGFVVVEEAVPQLQTLFDTLPVPDAGGYVELQQSQAGGVTVLMRRGNQALKEGPPGTLITLDGTPWKIAVWRRASSSFSETAPYILAWLVIALSMAVAVVATMLSLKRRMRENLKVMVALTADLRQHRLRPDYRASLEEFDAPLRAMIKLAQVLVGKQQEASAQARVDHLSQVYNRRSFEEKQKELFKTLKEGWSHSLLIMDVDNFKQINDTFGHEAGDQMIVAFGKALRDNLRSSDFIARLGGDEFCVVFPFTPLDKAQELADRLRAAMPATVELLPGVTHKLSWSGGLSEYHKADRQENAALIRADSALLEAKRSGRNTTRIKAAA